MTLGIIFAFFAMFAWGFGDFLIQRSVRKWGNWQTLFIITFVGTIILLPFVWSDLGHIFESTKTTTILIIASIVLFIGAILEFESLRIGKISVIEPIWSVEIPASAIFAYFILNESLTLIQIILLIILVVGLVLVSYKGKAFSKSFFLERGVLIALGAATIMGIANFFVGWGARETDPLMINFIITAFSFAGSAIVLISKRKLFSTLRDFRKQPKELLTMSLLDNGAWIAFAFAMVLIPIGLAVALSESYIIIVVLLGIFINKEKIQYHQKVGLIISIISAITISAMLI